LEDAADDDIDVDVDGTNEQEKKFIGRI